MGSKKKNVKEKPLEKMTAKELRDLAMEIKEVSGVHGMNKVELIAAIQKSRGIEVQGRSVSSSVREIKAKIKILKNKYAAAVKEGNQKMVLILKKRIIRLKKKTRRAA